MKKQFKKGDKVYFEYRDRDECKDVHGRGTVTEFDEANNQVIVQTTRKLHWVEPDGVNHVNPLAPQP